MHPEFFTMAPYTRVPDEFRWSLGLPFAVVAMDIVLRYVARRWFPRMNA